MNKYWLIALLCSYTGVGYVVYSWQSDKCAAQIAQNAEAQQKITISAEENVIKKERSDANISKTVDTDFQKDVVDITRQYDANSMPTNSTTSNSLPNSTDASSGFSSTQCAKASKKFQLTFKQCDVEEQKLISLWNWEGQIVK